jgi:chromate transporter
VREIAREFLKLGATAYGGPAIIGIMQAELQEKRQWVSKPRFVEGLSLANLLPGATATQLAMFLGYARGGGWGGLLAGLCFMIPGFVIILALTLAYASLGVSPILRGALYGLGPVVLGIYAVAVYRLGTTTVTTAAQAAVAVAAGAAVLMTPLGVATTLLLAGGLGIFLFHARRLGAIVLLVLAAALVAWHLAAPGLPALAPMTGAPRAATLSELALVLLKVGAFTFGGGLTMIPFIQEEVVAQRHWLSPQEFIDGLALGQFTPGPILMVAAYVGYKILGLAGAVVGVTAAFLPSFLMMLAVLPVLERGRRLAWANAAMKGIGPAVIGVLAVSLTQLAPHAVPDVVGAATLVATVVVLLVWRVATVKLMLAGALVGVVRKAYAWR